jgi:hypothetical protein
MGVVTFYDRLVIAIVQCYEFFISFELPVGQAGHPCVSQATDRITEGRRWMRQAELDSVSPLERVERHDPVLARPHALTRIRHLAFPPTDLVLTRVYLAT